MEFINSPLKIQLSRIVSKNAQVPSESSSFFDQWWFLMIILRGWRDANIKNHGLLFCPMPSFCHPKPKQFQNRSAVLDAPATGNWTVNLFYFLKKSKGRTNHCLLAWSRNGFLGAHLTSQLTPDRGGAKGALSFSCRFWGYYIRWYWSGHWN